MYNDAKKEIKGWIGERMWGWMDKKKTNYWSMSGVRM